MHIFFRYSKATCKLCFLTKLSPKNNVGTERPSVKYHRLNSKQRDIFGKKI